MTDRYEGAKFIHLREDLGYTNSHNGGATVAYKEVNGDTYVGVAHCHHKDRYVKAYGRAKAFGLLKQLIAKPKVYNGAENMGGVTQFIFGGVADPAALIAIMSEEAYVPR
jgi:hypothetical protein